MRIAIATPAPSGSRTGNRVTAERWRGILRSLGHQVSVHDPGSRSAGRESRTSLLGADLLIALHARKSLGALREFREASPGGRAVVGLAGTDLSEDLVADRRAEVLEAFELADRIVALHPLAALEVPEPHRAKVRVILQSALPLARPPPRARRSVALVVVGHLRPVKDPRLPAEALRLLPPASRIRITHYGAALDGDSLAGARAAMAADPRYRWLGERPRGEVRRAIARAHALLHPSLAEGGANTVGEALVLGTPVIASAVPGNLGLLGADYPGVFPPGDAPALAALLGRFESDPALRTRLGELCRALAERHRPEREAEAWSALLAELR